MEIVEPALTVFAFAPRGRAGAERVRELWGRIGAALGLDEALRAGVPVHWPTGTTPPDDWHERVVAARKATVPDGLAEAVAFDRRDFVGIGVALGLSGSHPLTAWQDLHGRLRDQLAGVPGVGLCFLGRLDAGLDQAGAHVQRVMADAGLDVWSDPQPVRDSGLRWDGTDGVHRISAILTPADEARAVEGWAWFGPSRHRFTLPLLARHWLNAALLDDQRTLLVDIDREVRRSIERADERAAEVVKESRRGLTERDSDALEARLADVTRDVVDLTAWHTRLEDARRALHSLHANLERIRTAFDGGEGVLLGRDVVTADRWLRQAEQTADHAESARLRAGEFVKLAQVELTVEQHRLTTRQQRSTRVQTALIAALLAGLGALNTLGVSYKPPPVVRLPLLVTLVGLLVAAPLLVGSLHSGRFRVVDCVASGFAAGAGVVAALAAPTGGRWWTLPIGLAVAVAVGWALRRRGRAGAPVKA